MPYLPLHYLYSIRTRICEHCGKPIEIYPSDISRGKGMFCSKSCAAYHKKTHKPQKICKTCGIAFKTITDNDFCSVECVNAYSES